MSRKKKILIVDDEQDVLIYLSTLFEDNGFETITAENGIEALKLAKAEFPDLITLDITMPEQSGIKTYRYLKNDINLQDVPVIIITAVGEPIKSVMNEFAAFPEPEAFISKPVDQKELIAIANELLA
ncbi:response regulator [bacterium]|nr:response regulator [bacterium]